LEVASAIVLCDRSKRQRSEDRIGLSTMTD